MQRQAEPVISSAATQPQPQLLHRQSAASAQLTLHSAPSIACGRKRKPDSGAGPEGRADWTDGGGSAQPASSGCISVSGCCSADKRRCSSWLRADIKAAAAAAAAATDRGATTLAGLPPLSGQPEPAAWAAELTPLRSLSDGRAPRMRLQLQPADDKQRREAEERIVTSAAVGASSVSLSLGLSADLPAAAALHNGRSSCKRKDAPAAASDDADGASEQATPAGWQLLMSGQARDSEVSHCSGGCKRPRLMLGAAGEKESTAAAAISLALPQHLTSSEVDAHTAPISRGEPTDAADDNDEEIEEAADADGERKEAAADPNGDHSDSPLPPQIVNNGIAAAVKADLIDDCDESLLSALSLSGASERSSPTLASTGSGLVSPAPAAGDDPDQPSAHSHANGCCAATVTLLRQKQQLRQALAAEHSLRRSAERQLHDARLRLAVAGAGTFATDSVAAGGTDGHSVSASPPQWSPIGYGHASGSAFDSFLPDSAFACSAQLQPFLFPHGLPAVAARQLVQQRRQWQPQPIFYS